MGGKGRFLFINYNLYVDVDNFMLEGILRVRLATLIMIVGSKKHCTFNRN